MEKEIKSIFDKTMEHFKSYSWGETSYDQACIINNETGIASVYNNLYFWLGEWKDNILKDLINGDYYLSKKEYLDIYNTLDNDDSRRKAIEDYICGDDSGN